MNKGKTESIQASENLRQRGVYLCIRAKDGQYNVEGTDHWSQGKALEDKQDQQNGTFLRWSWNGELLEIKNDRYGMYPLFYAELDNGIVISTTFTQVLAHADCASLDYTALSVYLRLGYLIGNDTPIKQIRLLPANSHLVWQAGQTTINERPVTECFSASSTLSYGEAIEGYNHYFSKAISRRLPGDTKFTVPISGGRDSRHIMFELVKQGVAPKQSVTLRYRPPATNEDERIGKLICQRLGVDHHVIDRPGNWFDVVREELFLSNFCGGGHSWILPMADFLVQQGYQTTYDGLAGDIISAGHTMDNEASGWLKEGKTEQYARKLLNASGYEDFNQYALTPRFARETAFEIALSHLVEELEKHLEVGNPLMAFTFWNRSRRAIGSIPYAILSGIPTVHCPYLDNDFFNFCTSLHPDFSINKPFHDDVIRQAYPRWADIPYEDKSLTARADKDCKLYYRNSVFDFIRYLWNRRGKQSSLLREKYVRARVAKNLILGTDEQPWYLRRALYMYELEQLLE